MKGLRLVYTSWVMIYGAYRIGGCFMFDLCVREQGGGEDEEDDGEEEEVPEDLAHLPWEKQQYRCIIIIIIILTITILLLLLLVLTVLPP
jgi:hypothetical protein